MAIDRSAVSRALAKAIAFKQCGKDQDAKEWAAELVHLLECADILSDRVRPGRLFKETWNERTPEGSVAP